MSYNIKYSSKDQFYDMAKEKMHRWSSQLDRVRQRLNVMTHLGSFQGEAADAMCSYFAGVHEPLLMFLQAAICEFGSALSAYSHGYYDIDSYGNAVLPEEAFEHIEKVLRNECAELQSDNDALRSIINGIDDIVPVSVPSTAEIYNAMKVLSYRIDELDHRVQQYESEWRSRADSSLADTLHTVTGTVNSYIRPVSVAGILGLVDFRPIITVGRREPFLLMMSMMLQKMKATTRGLMREVIRLQIRAIKDKDGWIDHIRHFGTGYRPALTAHFSPYMPGSPFLSEGFLEEMDRMLAEMEETSGNLAGMADQVASGEFLTPESPLVAWIKPFLPMIIFYLITHSYNIFGAEPALLIALVGAAIGGVGTGISGSGSAENAERVTSWSDAVLKGSIGGSGEFLGINTAGELKGELLGYSAGYDTVGELELKFDENGKLDKDSLKAKIGISGNIEGHVAKGEASGNIGYLNGSAEGTFLTGGAKGEAGLSLFDDGKFTPAVYAEVGVEGSVLEGEAEAHLGSDNNNIHGKAEGALLTAKAGAEGGAGRIKIEDDSGNEQVVWGVKGEAKAEAYLAEGSVSGGISIFGIDIDVELEGKAGGAGAGAGGYATAGGVCGELDVGLGLGAGVKIEVDWSDFDVNWPWE